MSQTLTREQSLDAEVAQYRPDEDPVPACLHHDGQGQRQQVEEDRRPGRGVRWSCAVGVQRSLLRVIEPFGIRAEMGLQAPWLLRATFAGYAGPVNRLPVQQNKRLPVLEMLGRTYSDQQWEDLCNRCAECCFESEWSDGRWVSTGVPCRYLDLTTRNCKVYTCRFEAEPQCNKVNPSAVLQGMLPTDCSYVEELQSIIEEDFEGVDPRLRGSRRRKNRARRKKGRHRER